MVYTEPTANRHQQISAAKYALTLATGFVLFLMIGMQLVLSSIYTGKVYPGVQVAGVKLGGLNLDQARQKLIAETKNYEVSLHIGSKQYQISSEKLGATYDYNATAQAAFMVGRGHGFVALGLLEAAQKGGIAYSYAVDHQVQQQFVEKVVAETGTAPVNAQVVANGGNFEVKPDQNGMGVSTTELSLVLEDAVSNTTEGTITITPKPQPAPIQVDDTGPAINQAKKLQSAKIELSYAGKKFIASPADIGQWISFVPEGQGENVRLEARVDEAKVKDYVLRLANGINKSPVNRKIRIENGVTSEERAGQDGLVVEDESVARKIVEAAKIAGSLSLEIPTKPVAFKTEYNRVITLDYGQYIEVNLSRQHLWAYQDKQVVFDAPITSGATGAGFPTVQGLFSIYNKQTNRNLNGYAIGYNYNVFVKYWMPFSGNFGLHDASWRSSFGGPDYYYGGSHGCVNMPEYAAAFLFGWAPVGTPVWVHS